MENSTTSITVRNGRILRRAIIPAGIHQAAKLMARSRNVSVGEIYDEAVSQLLSHAQSAKIPYRRVGRLNNPPKVSFWLDAKISEKAKAQAAAEGLTEHEVIITAIDAFAAAHHFTKVSQI